MAARQVGRFFAWARRHAQPPGAVVSDYAAALIGHNVPPCLPGGEVRTTWLTIENRGAKTWVQADARLSVNVDGVPILPLELPHSVAPGERVTVSWVLRIPADAGRHEFQLDLVGTRTTSPEPAPTPLPAPAGSYTFAIVRIPFDVVIEAPSESRRLRDLVYENHARCWLPCDGMTWSSSGSGYPQFARAARGCWIVDVEGRRYVDYLMGWGSALLGYAEERIQQAIVEALHSAAIPTLTHHLMPEVGRMLCEAFPGAGAATFGKNGSDVCTAAVRLARVHTGRPIVLFCGYHGWQDWYVERFGFATTGVPPRQEPLLIPFAFNDLPQVVELFETHRGRVAAVMLEPAGPLSGNGTILDVDPVFLADVSALARKEGALVIFDEIMTGFRYRGGAVQRATGVVPDLTCLGKALSGGMPLSALVGKREIFQASIGRISYEPTFKGEAYSFAAARAALSIYRAEDIPARVWDFGERLRTVIQALCEEARVPARVIGPPYRMMLVLDETDPRRRALMRTLLHQELLAHGLLTTQHLLLPSAAHDDEALGVTRHAFERALAVLAAAMKDDSFASRLEIPMLLG
jgi:glutamate-1-semialdehyde 2,1-aminomutase